MKKPLRLLALLATVISSIVISGPLYASKTDDHIESFARKSYIFRTYLKEDTIEIQAKNGVATLTGTVFDESHKFLAGDTLARLPGVTEVENKLKETGEAPAVNTDAWLINKIKLLLMFHKRVNAVETEVSARNGTVTLRGKAGSMAQKDLTIEYVKDVEGVKKVKSKMTVSSSVPQPVENIADKKTDTISEGIDDASITVLVEMMLLNHRSTNALDPVVLTKEGVVRLRGNARNAAKKRLVGKYVSDVHGVKRVINEMSFE